MGITFATYITGKRTRSLPPLVKCSPVFLAQNLQPRRTSEYYIIIIVVKTSGDNGVLSMLDSYTYFSFAVLVTFLFCFFLYLLSCPCKFFYVSVSFFSFSFFSLCVISQFFFCLERGKGV